MKQKRRLGVYRRHAVHRPVRRAFTPVAEPSVCQEEAMPKRLSPSLATPQRLLAALLILLCGAAPLIPAAARNESATAPGRETPGSLQAVGANGEGKGFCP